MIDIINTCQLTAQEVRPIAYYAHLVPFAIGFCIALFVISKNKITALTGSFFTFVLMFNLWLIGDLIPWVSNDYDLVNTAWQTLDFINIVAFLSAVFFFDIYAMGRVTIKKKLFMLALTLPALFIVLKGGAITGFFQPFCESVENTLLTNYKIFVEGISLIMIAGTAFRAWHTFDSQRKKATIIICSSLIAFLAIFATTEYWATQFDIYEISLYGLFALPIFQLMIMLTTTQLGTFNLKSWNQQLLGFILVIMIASQLFFLKNTTDLTLNLFTLFISFFLAYFLNKSIKNEMENKKKLEELTKTLQTSNERLKELDQQKSEFLSLASHQLRGPLAAIKGYTSLILEGDFGELKKEVRDALETVFRSTQALVVIVGDYLDVSRIDQGKMKYDFADFDFAELVENVTKELAPSIEAEKKIKFSFSYDKTKDYQIRADMGKIKQVISNLIDNSLKYTKEGEIKVIVQRTPLNKLQFKVSDTGVGIAPETMSKLFERFVRESDASKTNIMGTGLGLYIAKKMIEAHRGKIWAESAGKGKGASFSIELDPIHSDPERKFDDVVTGRLG